MIPFLLGLAEGWTSGLDYALRASLVLAVAWLMTTLLSRRSAAARHLVWSAAMVAVILLPLAQRFVPNWRILPPESKALDVYDSSLPAVVFERRTSRQALGGAASSPQSLTSVATNSTSDESMIAAIAVAQPEPAIEEHRVRGTPVTTQTANLVWPVGSAATVVWLIGVLLCCLPVLLGTARVWRLRQSRQPVPNSIIEEVTQLASDLRVSRRVEVVLSREREIPMTWGFFMPVLLLPASATEWSIERRRMVLLHELAHVRRWDCLTLLVGQFARALHWFNPLAWLALQRLRIEQERACDDVVLNCGTNADEYASELLSVTARLPRPNWDAAVALAMSRCDRIEQRLKSILNVDCERRPTSRRQVLATCVLMMIVSYGVAAAQRRVAEGDMPLSDRIAFVSEDAPPAGQDAKSVEAANTESAAEPAPAQDDALRLALEKIAQVTPKPVDPKALSEAAIRGMLQSLNDPYSSLMSTEQMNEFRVLIDGSLVGIGAALKKEGDAIEVTSVLPNSPALRGGLKSRDVILEINSQPAKELNETVKLIRGQAGTEVTLKIRRADKSESLTLKRAEVHLPTVKGLSLDEQGQWQFWLDADQKIAFVQITQFDQATPDDLKETLTRLNEQGLKGLILDLRGNVGGLLVSSVEVARMFLKEGTIAKIRGRPPQQNSEFHVPSPHSPLLAETPLLVLVDSTTASAAEVLAAALKENNRAILVGERTFGKGSVQSILPLGSEGQSLKLTTAMIFSPNGQSLHRSADSEMWGVDPHDGYFVPLTGEQRAMRQQTVLSRETEILPLEATVTPEFVSQDATDPQLAAALISLSAKLKTGDFAKTGQPLADQKFLLSQRDELRKQRDELREKLEQLDRLLGEVH